MTTGKRLAEFGKRGATPLPPAPGPKRSGHVALLVMGTLTVGGGAYALMPSQNCQPPSPAKTAPATQPGMAAPAGQPATAAPTTPPANTACTSRRSSGGSGGSYGRSWRFGLFDSSSSRDSSAHGSSAGASEASSGVTRGGFGSFAHAFGFSGGS